MQQLGHNGADTAEVYWTAQATELFGENVHIHKAAKALGIHFFRCRVEDQCGTSTLAECSIVFQIPRIAFQIFVGSELGRIDKDADHNTVVLCTGFRNQALMPFVQVTHGRNQSDGQSLFSPSLDLFPYFCNCFYDFHACASCSSCAITSSEMANECSSVGKFPSCISLRYDANASCITFPTSANFRTNFGR